MTWRRCETEYKELLQQLCDADADMTVQAFREQNVTCCNYKERQAQKSSGRSMTIGSKSSLLSTMWSDVGKAREVAQEAPRKKKEGRPLTAEEHGDAEKPAKKMATKVAATSPATFTATHKKNGGEKGGRHKGPASSKKSCNDDLTSCPESSKIHAFFEQQKRGLVSR
jgi:hypothetical protein